jgi:hypothetical protein
MTASAAPDHRVHRVLPDIAVHGTPSRRRNELDRKVCRFICDNRLAVLLSDRANRMASLAREGWSIMFMTLRLSASA